MVSRLLNKGDCLFRIGVQHPGQRSGVDTKDEEQGEQRNNDPPFCHGQLGDLFFHLSRGETRHRPLVHPHDVEGGKHHGDGRDARSPRVLRPGSCQHTELRHEGCQAGERQGRQTSDEEESGKYRGNLLYATEVVDLRGATTLHQVTNKEEERGG